MGLKRFHQCRQGLIYGNGNTGFAGLGNHGTVNSADFAEPMMVHILSHGRPVFGGGFSDVVHMFYNVVSD